MFSSRLLFLFIFQFAMLIVGCTEKLVVYIVLKFSKDLKLLKI